MVFDYAVVGRHASFAQAEARALSATALSLWHRFEGSLERIPRKSRCSR